MIDFAAAAKLYEDALGRARPDELIGVADSLAALIASATDNAIRADLSACRLHLLSVASLNGSRLGEIEDHRHAIMELVRDRSSPIVQTVSAIISFCSYYSSDDPTRLDEAIQKFGAIGRASGLGRLDTAALINEIASHSQGLIRNVASVSVDRVDELAELLDGRELPDRLRIIRDTVLATFFRNLALRYGDDRFLKQGTQHLRVGLAADRTSAVFRNALSAFWLLAIPGFEMNENFPLPRDLVHASQCLVRRERHASDPVLADNVSGIAFGLGIRARFDFERHGKQTGVLRALSYLRIAARRIARRGALGTTMRVAYEAGMGVEYLDASAEVFQSMAGDSSYHYTTPDLNNYGSTLMFQGMIRREASLLRRAIEQFEAAIDRDGRRSAINIPRYLNVALAVTALLDIDQKGLESNLDASGLFGRALGYLVAAAVLNSPGSTHTKILQERIATYRERFDLIAGRGKCATRMLELSLEMFAGDEEVWPIGFAAFVTDRLDELLTEAEPDLALIQKGVAAIARSKPLLLLLDLADGISGPAADLIDRIFGLAIGAYVTFAQMQEAAAGLTELETLTGGFLSQVAGVKGIGTELDVVITKAIAGSPLSSTEIGRIRRFATSIAHPTTSRPLTSAVEHPRACKVSVLAGSGRILCILTSPARRVHSVFSARNVPTGHVTEDICRHMAAFLATSVAVDAQTISVATRGLLPMMANELFLRLRDSLNAVLPTAVLLRRDAHSFSAFRDPKPELPPTADRRVLLVHSPANSAPSLNYGFQFASRLRNSTKAYVDELAEEDATLSAIAEALPGSDVLIVVSHGASSRPDGAADRILLADDDALDAKWMLENAEGLGGKLVVLVACNSGYINARLASEDVGLGPLLIYVGASAAFVTLRNVDELTILMMVLRAIQTWNDEVPLFAALEKTRLEMLRWNDTIWSAEQRRFVGGGMAARIGYSRLQREVSGQSAHTLDRGADIDVGWAFYQS